MPRRRKRRSKRKSQATSPPSSKPSSSGEAVVDTVLDYLPQVLGFLPRELIHLVRGYTIDLFLQLDSLLFAANQSNLEEWLLNLKLVQEKRLDGTIATNLCSKLCSGRHDYQLKEGQVCPYTPKIILPWGQLHRPSMYPLMYEVDNPFDWSRIHQHYENMETIRKRVKQLCCRHRDNENVNAALENFL